MGINQLLTCIDLPDPNKSVRIIAISLQITLSFVQRKLFKTDAKYQKFRKNQVN